MSSYQKQFGISILCKSNNFNKSITSPLQKMHEKLFEIISKTTSTTFDIMNSNTSVLIRMSVILECQVERLSVVSFAESNRLDNQKNQFGSYWVCNLKVEYFRRVH